jgi:ABC-type multidrug transport system ATPase subunit
MQPVIEVSGLSKLYGSFRAVDDLSFRVHAGDVFGFLGQNGAGKSTTIRMLLTLISPSSGRIEIFGKELAAHRKEILQRTGAIIEKPDLYTYLNGFDNLSIFARLSGKKHTRKGLQDMLDRVGLSARSADKVRTYSQGMKQRLGIACALVHDPDLIILDEPTNGLDPQGIADMRNLIIGLSRERGKTFVVSSHLLAEIELIANRMLIIDRGRKMVEGHVKDLVDPERLLLELGTNDDEACLKLLIDTGRAQSLRQGQQGRILLDIPRNEVPVLVRELVEKQVEINTLKPVNSLEEYFLSLTKDKAHVETGTN